MSKNRKMTIPDFRLMKKEGRKITVLTAYDYLIARTLDRAGIDAVLVGDSVGMVFSGHDTTIPVTLDEMIYHGKAARRGVTRASLIIDMPFMSYQIGQEQALLNCGRVMKETLANAVKVEGGVEVCETVRALTRASIPVMGHIGLTPQSIHMIGGYRVQGVEDEQARKLVDDAVCLQEAGCFSMVLEMIPAELSREISEKVDIPTIGIGAGPHCDGQVLVIYDMLGLNEDFKARFFKTYADLAAVIKESVNLYIDEVRSGSFPTSEHSFHLEDK
jgi:3-methyl-2-oxobutanoate hydroxymethyltransferase